MPRVLHLCLCPSESLLGQVVGGPLGTALPVPTAGGLAPWGCAGSSELFSPPPGPNRATGRVHQIGDPEASPSAQASADSCRREGCPGGAGLTLGEAGCSDR